MATDGMKQRVRFLEKRIAKLEKAAVLFEEHRQSWIELNKGLKKLKQEMDRDRRKQLARDNRIKGLGPAADSSSLFTRMGASGSGR
jgi:exonuclease VII small subunit